MSSDSQPTPGALSAELVPSSLRRQVLSGTRIKVAFTVVTLTLLAVLSTMMVLSVEHIFTWLTPLAHNDLYWKAQHGVAELGRATDFPIVLRDTTLLQATVRNYEQDQEVVLLEVQDTEGAVLYRHRKSDALRVNVFEKSADEVHAAQGYIWSWTEVRVEGAPVGKLGLAISTARLQAGERLRTRIVRLALGACFAAIVLSLLFVGLYVSPIIKMTKNAFLDLEKKTSEALEATRVKSEFLANMSHEIRTPLNGIIGMLGMLMRGDLTPRQRARAEIGHTSARSLLALINDILDFSKMEAGHYVVHPVECDPRLLVQNRVELLAVKAHAKQLEIAYRIAPDVPPIVQIDSDRVTQILTNLVGNAIKFTETGEVTVSLTVDGSADTASEEIMLRFEVHDTGVGIPPEGHHRLFRSFSQVDASSTRSHEGTGLGLAISKHLVEMMGGAIGVESVPQKGSTFWFTIRCPTVQRKRAAPSRAGSLPGRRILIADSSAMYRNLLGEYASHWGMQVAKADSDDHALSLVREAKASGRPFEFAVVDDKLIDAGAVPFADALKQVESSELILIQLTPAMWTPQEDDPGAQVFLTKPVRESELYDYIATQTTADRKATAQQTERDWGSVGARQGHFLVVDDNEVNRVLAQEMLHDLGHTCDLASSGQEAIEKASARLYDGILMDCQMPGMNGYQATHEIRTREARGRRRSPIIALTAHAFSGEAEKVKAAGMDDFLTKPVELYLLESTLQKRMAVSGTGRPRLQVGDDVTATVELALMKGPPANDMGFAGQTRATEAMTERGSSQTVSGGPQDPATGHPVLLERRRSARLAETFLRAVPSQIELLRHACSDNAHLELREHAHKLKGSSASIGAVRLSKLCEAIQYAVDGETTEHVFSWSEQVEQEFKQVEVLLRSELAAKQA